MDLLNNYFLRILTWAILFVFINSCSSRGMTLGEQIPSFHRDFDPSKKQVFAIEGKIDQVVYSNYTSKELAELMKPKASFAIQITYPTVKATTQSHGALLNDETLTASERADINFETSLSH